MAVFICHYCGATFRAAPCRRLGAKKFCNSRCHGGWLAAHNTGTANPLYTGIEVACTYCGKALMRRPCELKEHPSPFCSTRCQGKWNTEHRTGVNAAHWKGGPPKAVCSTCGSPFDATPHRLKRSKELFCCRGCQAEWASLHRTGANSQHWQGDRLVVTCAMCGKEKRTEGNHLRRNTHHFCGRACKAAWMSANRSGPNSPAWKGGEVDYYGPNWNAQKRAARKRDGYKCQHCGQTQKRAKRALDVHHIRPFREFGYILNQNDNYLQANDLTNLIALCRVCHKKAEYGKIAIQPYLL